MGIKYQHMAGKAQQPSCNLKLIDNHNVIPLYDKIRPPIIRIYNVYIPSYILYTFTTALPVTVNK